MEEARKKVLEDGFQFVRGKSRKKSLSKHGTEPKPKRQKMNQEVRETRMKELEETKRRLRITMKEFHSKRNEFKYF